VGWWTRHGFVPDGVRGPRASLSIVGASSDKLTVAGSKYSFAARMPGDPGGVSQGSERLSFEANAFSDPADLVLGRRAWSTHGLRHSENVRAASPIGTLARL